MDAGQACDHGLVNCDISIRQIDTTHLHGKDTFINGQKKGCTNEKHLHWPALE